MEHAPNFDTIRTAKAAAEFAGISEGLVRKLLAKGEFPSEYICSTGKTSGRGGRRIFSKRKIQAWKETREHSRPVFLDLAQRLPDPNLAAIFAKVEQTSAALARLSAEVQMHLPGFTVTVDGSLVKAKRH